MVDCKRINFMHTYVQLLHSFEEKILSLALRYCWKPTNKSLDKHTPRHRESINQHNRSNRIVIKLFWYNSIYFLASNAALNRLNVCAPWSHHFLSAQIFVSSNAARLFECKSSSDLSDNRQLWYLGLSRASLCFVHQLAASGDNIIKKQEIPKTLDHSPASSLMRGGCFPTPVDLGYHSDHK